MGFGFFGKYQQRVDLSMQGWGASSVDRRVLVHNCSAWSKNAVTNFIYKGTNTGATPDLQKLLTATVVSFNAADSRSLPSTSEIALAASSAAPVRNNLFSGGNDYRGFRYEASAGLSPISRALSLIFHRPDLIKHVSFAGDTGSGSGNYLEGEFALPYLVHAKTISFLGQTGGQAGVAITSITGMFPPNLLGFMYHGGDVRISSIQCRFPRSVRWLILGSNNPTFGLASNINNLISECVNLEALLFTNENWQDGGATTGAMTPVNGVLVLPTMPSLKYFTLVSALVTNITYIAGQFALIKRIQLYQCTTLDATTLWSIINESLASPVLETFNIRLNNRAYTRNFTDSDFSTSLQQFIIYGNQFTGSISLTIPKPAIQTFAIGDIDSNLASSGKNTYSNVDVSGLTDASVIDLSNSRIENLILPQNTVITSLFLGGNKLDLTVNPLLLSQITAMTSLISLRMSSGGSVSSGIDSGQDSTNGLGAVDISGLTSLTTLYISTCKLTGTLKLPPSSVTLIARSNPLLTDVSGAGLSLLFLSVNDCTSLIYDFSKTPNLTTIAASRIANEVIDLSGKTTITNYGTSAIGVGNCPNLTTIKFPATPGHGLLGNSSNAIAIANNPVLATLENLENLSWISLTLGGRSFNASNCALNIDFKIGVNEWLPAAIQVQNNRMSTAMVDLNIMNIVNNRTKWSTTTIPKTANFGGNNARPSGTYQAPAGFSLGVSDGAPASVLEWVYVLSNNDGFIILYTP